MCGIVGAIGCLDDAVIRAVHCMNACQAHRGPDGNGFFKSVSGSPEMGVAFGHRRLAVIDLSSDGHQPMTDPVTGNVIVFNGEIYNYPDLARELKSRGHVLRTSSDTEVLLTAYACWGPEVVHRLRGMFAFAIWEPLRRRVFLARDRLGIKPLYWCSARSAGDRPVVLFASEIRSLLATGMVERRLSRVGLSTYMWNGFVAGPNTIVEGVTLLGSGEMAMVQADAPTVEPQRYWNLPAPSEGGSQDIESVRQQLTETVRLHMISDVPVGVFLSGGIDSSALAALAVRGTDPRSVGTYNIAFEEAAFDESVHARKIASIIGTDHHELRLTRGQFVHHLPDALGSLDQPTFDAINTYFVSRLVRESGLKVALAGTGGDELFGGYRTFVQLPALQSWARRLRHVPKFVLWRLGGLLCRLKMGREGMVPVQTKWGKLGDALCTRGDLLQLYQIAYGIFSIGFYRQLFEPDETNTEFGLPIERALELRRATLQGPISSAISTLELSCFIGDRLLRDTDSASKGVSLEVRVPFLDHALIESVSSLEASTRFRYAGSKQLLRELALGELDPSLFDRPKSGFVLPLEVWCRTILRDQVHELFSDSALCARVGIRQDVLLRLWRAFESGAPGLYWSRIWAIFVLLWWCRTQRVSL